MKRLTDWLCAHGFHDWSQWRHDYARQMGLIRNCFRCFAKETQPPGPWPPPPARTISIQLRTGKPASIRDDFLEPGVEGAPLHSFRKHDLRELSRRAMRGDRGAALLFLEEITTRAVGDPL